MIDLYRKALAGKNLTEFELVYGTENNRFDYVLKHKLYPQINIVLPRKSLDSKFLIDIAMLIQNCLLVNCECCTDEEADLNAQRALDHISNLISRIKQKI